MLAPAVLLGRTLVANFLLVSAVGMICGGGRVLASAKGRVVHINVSVSATSLVGGGKGVGVGAVTKGNVEVIREVSSRVRLGVSSGARIRTVLM